MCMRADRVLATLLFLQARGRVTAAEVAHEFEVSVATARRDLESLSRAGVPVYPQRGRGGGWQLVGGARTDLTGFTATEATALLLLLGPSVASSPALTSAVRKLLRALPEPFRDHAAAAARAVVADPGGWGERVPIRPEAVDVLQAAVVQRRQVSFDYAGRTTPAGHRVVDPHGLVDKDSVWYLVAGTPSGERTFRVDRITSVDISEEPASRPPGFDLEGHWNHVADHVEQQRSSVHATVLTSQRLVPVLQALFGQHCVPERSESGCRVRVHVASHTAVSIAEILAGFGGEVQVLDPEPVKIELARLGAELVAQYDREGPLTHSAPAISS